MFVNQVLSHLHRGHIPFNFGFCGAASDFGSKDNVVPTARPRTDENRMTPHCDPALLALFPTYVTKCTSIL